MEAYRESVLPSDVSARVAVEAGIADYWYKYVGLKEKIVGMTGYGESAPADKLSPYFGFTVEHIVSVGDEDRTGNLAWARRLAPAVSHCGCCA